MNNTFASEPIKIGLTLGLTGKYAKMGDMQEKGFMLRERHVKERNADIKVLFITGYDG